MHEGSLTASYAWCVYNSTNLSANSNSVPLTAAQYVLAYQRLSNLIKTNTSYVDMAWEISRDSNAGAQDQLDIFYPPGNSYVDICSINTYNRYGLSSGYQYWNSFGASLRPALDHVRRIAPNKPIMIGETSSNIDGYVSSVTVNNGGSGLLGRHNCHDN